MGGLPKRYVYIAIIAALLLLWRSSARAEGYAQGGGKGWVLRGLQNIQDPNAKYMEGTIDECKKACTDDDNCVGFSIRRRKNKYKKGPTKCWLLQDGPAVVNSFTKDVDKGKLKEDKTKNLYIKSDRWLSSTTSGNNRAAVIGAAIDKANAAAAANTPAPSNNEGAAGPAPVVNVTGLKVQLWEGINFEGASKGRFGITNGPINVPRGISSIEIPAGLKVTASFTQPGCRDYAEGTNICVDRYPKSTIEYTADVTNVGTEWNDNISEITVTAA